MTTTRTAPSLFTTWSLLEQTYALLYRNLERQVTEVGLSQAQVSILFDLKAVGHSLPLSRIGSMRAIQSPTVTALADRLEARGLVRRLRTSRDRRVINLELTSAGVALCEALYPAQLRSLTQNFAALGAREFQELTKSLRLLRNGGTDLLRLRRRAGEEAEA